MSSERPDVLQAQFVAFALLASPWVQALILGILTATGSLSPEGFAPELAIPRSVGMAAVLVVAAVPVMAGFLVRQAMLARLRPNADISGRMPIVVVSLALAEAGSVLGLVYALLTGHLLGGFLAMGVAFVGGLLFFPSRAWLEGR